jgi:hypothetical protein
LGGGAYFERILMSLPEQIDGQHSRPSKYAKLQKRKAIRQNRHSARQLLRELEQPDAPTYKKFKGWEL